MTRKKNAKSKKPATKRNAMKSTLPSSEKMEKEFRSMPAKLAAQCRSELKDLKRQEMQLKADLKKNQQKLTTKQTQSTLAKTKTPAAKKKLMAAKKNNKILNKTIKDILGKLKTMDKTSKLLAAKQNKFSALTTQLNKLEKNLMKKSAKPATRKKPVKKIKQIEQDTTTPAQELPFTTFYNKNETTEVS